ncbi:MAG: HAD family hydrolase [Chloroflexota bacterium]|nr:HAD family hydrolase [Chloroflexota bacterium]MDE2960112.1 HAD family hydrolase [Chloroflexota bacterium]
MNQIKAIFFDGDDTLWDFRSAMLQALEVTLAELRRVVGNPAADALTVARMAEIREAVADELGESTTSVEVIRREALARTLAEVGHPSDDGAQRLYEVYTEARFTATHPFPGVVDVLNDLKSRYRLGLVSNGNTYPERVGLGDVFSFVLLAVECGIAKPDPRIFELALGKCGCDPTQVVHVGDSLQSDIVGANGCGIRSVWLNADGVANNSGVTPDHEIGDLRELLDIL